MAHCNTNSCATTIANVDDIPTCACTCKDCREETVRQLRKKQKDDLDALRAQMEKALSDAGYPLKLPRS